MILDLLSSLRGQDMPVRALIAAGELFDISAESMRVALVRLCASGTIERNERGLYRIAAAAQAVQAHVTSWTRIEDRVVPWRGGWIGVHTARLERGDRGAAKRRLRALEFLGFRTLSPHLFVRPDNLRGGVEAVRAELHGLGLERDALVVGLDQLDSETEARARRLWDGAALCRAYRDSCSALQRSAAQLEHAPVRKAMVESFILGGRAIRQLALDPLLPEPIIPAGSRAALVEIMREYDRLGRACWRSLMKSHGAPHLQTPRTAVAARWPHSAAEGVA